MSKNDFKIKDTTIPFEEWETYVTKMNESLSNILQAPLSDMRIDLSGVNYLQSVITAYMTSPVGVYNGHPLEAKTRRVDDLYEARNELASLGVPIILYQLIWHPSVPQYVGMDLDTFAPIALEKPGIIGGWWKLRFAEGAPSLCSDAQAELLADKMIAATKGTL